MRIAPVLVHGVHVAQPRDDEVDNGAPCRHNPVVFAGVIDLFRCVLCFCEALVDGFRGDLGLGQRVNEVLVVENVPCVVAAAGRTKLWRACRTAEERCCSGNMRFTRRNISFPPRAFE